MPVGPGQIAGEDAGGEAEGGVIGEAHRLLLVVEGEDAQHRAEQLLATQGTVCVRRVEDGRRDSRSLRRSLPAACRR